MVVNIVSQFVSKTVNYLDSKNTACSLYTGIFNIYILSDIQTKLLTKLAIFLVISLVQLNR